MFVAQRIFRIRAACSICTSTVLKCDERPKNEVVVQNKKKLDKKSSDKKLYLSKIGDNEKTEAKKKLMLLLEDFGKQGDIFENEKTKIKISQPENIRRKKKDIQHPTQNSFSENLNQSIEKVADDLRDEAVKRDLRNAVKTFAFYEGSPESKDGKLSKYHIKKLQPEVPNEKKLYQHIKPFAESPPRKEIVSKITSILKNIQKVESQYSSDLSGENLGIFTSKNWASEVNLMIWDELEELEMKFQAGIPPRNYFEENILWTEQGKLWHFPIDNDQSMESEAGVDFTEHLFLDDYLEPWCPKTGPLRHFMELVITGLSKNPYLMVEDKLDHINWFRDYFESKRKLLTELGALTVPKEIEK